MLFNSKYFEDKRIISHEVLTEVEWVRKHLVGKTVLDVACGVGRHGYLLEYYGFEVTYFDISKDALRCIWWSKKKICGDFVSYDFKMAKLCNKVLAIEPNPYNVQGLLMNIALNKLTNVEVHNIALSDETCKLYTGTVGLREDLANRCFQDPTKNALEIDCKRLDDVVSSCDLIKVDAEGYEHKILKGGRRVIEKHMPYIAIETHEKAWNIPMQVKEIEKFLVELGYRLEKIPIERGDFFIFAEPKS